MQIAPDSTSKSINLYITDALGNPKTGLAYNSAGALAYYTRQGAAASAITLATLASASAAWSSGGFVEVSAANAPGLYRLDIPNAALATGVNQVYVSVQFTSALCAPLAIDLVTVPSAATIAAAVADEVLTGHTTASTLGKIISDINTAVAAIKAITDVLISPNTIADALLKRSLGSVTGAAMLSPYTAIMRLISRTSVNTGTNELAVYDLNGTTKLIEQDATFNGSGLITDLSVGRTPT